MFLSYQSLQKTDTGCAFRRCLLLKGQDYEVGNRRLQGGAPVAYAVTYKALLYAWPIWPKSRGV